jgi:signal transduction histidine kinase/AmiR/NasT family two-component response regulator
MTDTTSIEKSKTYGYCLIRVELDNSGKPVDLTLLHANEELAQIIEKPLSQLIGHSFCEVFQNESSEWLNFYYEAAYNGKSCTLDGVFDEVEAYLRIEAYPAGIEGCCASVICDIRESVFFKLEQQAAKHAEVVSALTTIYTTIMEADLTNNGYRIIQTSSPMKTVVGGNDQGNFDKVVEDVLKFYMHPDDIDRMREFINLSTLSERFGDNTTLVTEYRAPYGKWFEARFIANNRDEEGRVISAIYAARDITSEKEKELHYRGQLQEQLSVFNVLSRNFKNVYLVDLKNETVKILKLEADYVDVQNEGIDREFPFDIILGNWLNNVVCQDDREELSKIFTVENVSKRLAAEKEFTGNYRSEVDGEVHYFQYNVSIVNEDGTKVIFGFQNIDDIICTQLEEEKKRRELEQKYQEQLRTAADKAESANKAKTEFLLRMSHDIRTPLNGIRGMLDMADYYGNDLEKVRECRRKVRESSNILLELINEVLDMSKLESNDVVLEHVPFDLTAISYEVYTVVEKMADEQTVEIIEEHDIQHTRFIGSPIHFKRLILNILGNAVKYNRPHGKVYVTCRETEFDGKTTVLETVIRDTGIGMSEEFQKHIFEPFQQEDSSARSKYGGSGLGLSISKSLVDKMGGTISCESIKDVGTTFTMRIPLEVDFSEHTDAVDSEEYDVSVVGETVILAEDNDINLEIAQFILKNAGIKIVAAHNGEEAVNSFATSKPGEISAILMDIMMPVVDGYEATRQIRAMERPDAKTIPIIAMTANAFAEDRIATKKAGMNAHIAKPLDAKEVIRVIAEQLKASRDTKAAEQ